MYVFWPMTWPRLYSTSNRSKQRCNFFFIALNRRVSDAYWLDLLSESHLTLWIIEVARLFIFIESVFLIIHSWYWINWIIFKGCVDNDMKTIWGKEKKICNEGAMNFTDQTTFYNKRKKITALYFSTLLRGWFWFI